MALRQTLPAEFDRSVVTTIHQGDYRVSDQTAVTLSTVLGSCVSACVHDAVARVGGMNHFLLAEQPGSAREKFGASARYGAFAMERLINRVLSLGTGDKANLEIKIFGGGRINTALDDVGGKNIDFVRGFLRAEGYDIAGHDLGGNFARRVLFKPASGRVFVKRLDSAAGMLIATQELVDARSKHGGKQALPDIELF
ncbi:hypothetical protein PSQ90_09585 [Devosia rhodophyticola]|uniref:Probable chemoreceptor glutamine deamidase CheD n=1 Tax=Devosia rhodophyticola TaxID=3026423 RepID=A0ABY7YUF7_9HYPH|nr:hypothetical protein [Devosia rhodophyticola]WDR04584.1 hypothetical protein PSQ90_09585 [Devosia rhodophyticola]